MSSKSHCKRELILLNFLRLIKSIPLLLMLLVKMPAYNLRIPRARLTTPAVAVSAIFILLSLCWDKPFPSVRPVIESTSLYCQSNKQFAEKEVQRSFRTDKLRFQLLNKSLVRNSGSQVRLSPSLRKGFSSALWSI